MLRKRGSFLTENLLGVILAAGIVFILILLLKTLLFPGFNAEKETSLEYLNSFMEAYKNALNKGEGTFSFLGVPSDMEYYLVYFGKKNSIVFRFDDERGRTFERAFLPKNPSLYSKVCICSYKGGAGECHACKNINYNLRFDEKKEGAFSARLIGSIPAKLINKDDFVLFSFKKNLIYEGVKDGK